MTPTQLKLVLEDGGVETLAVACDEAVDYPGERKRMIELAKAYRAVGRYLLKLSQKGQVKKKS